MAKKRKSKSENYSPKNFSKKISTTEYSPFNNLKTETKHTIIAIIFFVVAIFFLMSLFNLGGKVGTIAYDIFHYLLGLGYILLPSLFILL